MNPSQSIKDRFNKQGQFKIDSDDAFVRIHHILMKEYGWIPYNEYAELPLATIWNLLDCIKEDREEEKRHMEKAKRKR